MNVHRRKGLLRDQRGAVAIIVGISLVLILGIAALAVDGGYLYVLKNRLQVSADSAALAGASVLPVEGDVRSVAVEYAGKNLPAADHGMVLADADVVLGNWDKDTRTFTPAGVPINAVMVTTKRAEANDNPAPLYFAKVLGFQETDVETMAIAWPAPGEGDEFCILSLDPVSPGAIKINGTVNLDLGDCGMTTTSTNPNKSLIVNGTVDITAGSICVAGGVKDGGSVTYTPGPEIVEEGCKPPEDPLTDLPPPSYSGCDHTDYVVGGSYATVTLTPGVYCGGMKFTGAHNNITFQSGGVFVLAGGGMSATGGDNTYDGTEVMFYNTNYPSLGYDFGDVDFGGGSIVNLSAPMSGDYAGVLFFQDPSPDGAAANIEFKVAGTVTSNMDGVIYFPNHLIVYSGTTDITNPCGPKIIGKTVIFNGTVATFGGATGCASDLVIIAGDKLQLVY